jgi:hypothetical protein
MHENAYGSMTNPNAGDASISQPDPNQIRISDASLGPTDSPDASKMPSLQSLEVMVAQLLESQAAERAAREKGQAKLVQLFESQTAALASMAATLSRIDCRLTAVEE